MNDETVGRITQLIVDPISTEGDYAALLKERNEYKRQRDLAVEQLGATFGWLVCKGQKPGDKLIRHGRRKQIKSVIRECEDGNN